MTGNQKIDMKKEEKSECVSLSPMAECVPAPPKCEKVCVFGTGDLWCTLSLILLQVLANAAAAQSACLIFIAVQREHYDFLVLVDLSNNLRKNQYPEAKAE
ncbi:unnamed protein product [Coregonus sp. 'balchen']|nr:unnamed protein product [Coregonus sp. 'balchen']